MMLRDRAAAFNRAYAKWPASHLHVVQEQGRDVLYGRWVIGNDYRNKTRYYGAYPAGYLERVMALFGDVPPKNAHREWTRLHVFSGSVPAGPHDRCDLKSECEWRGSVYDIADLVGTRRSSLYDLVLADPPYSSADAEKYGTAGVDRRRATAALARVTRVGGYLAWLDQCWPMHAKRDWLTVGRIAITRSTNHRLRDLTIFQRRAA
jgi:hypothetical protein